MCVQLANTITWSKSQCLQALAAVLVVGRFLPFCTTQNRVPVGLSYRVVFSRREIVHPAEFVLHTPQEKLMYLLRGNAPVRR